MRRRGWLESYPHYTRQILVTIPYLLWYDGGIEQFLANGEALLPFEGLSVYYSGSISGGPELDLSLPRKLVEYMQQGGAVVLDPFVAIPSKLEPDAFFGGVGCSP